MVSTSLSFFGGVNEIGGNKILLVGGNGKGILLDFGWSFKISHDYLQQFLTLRKHQRLFDGIVIGDLPIPKDDLEGLYREDLYQFIEKECKNRFGITKGKPKVVQEVLISHAHSDHIGDIKYLHPKIKLVCSNSTKIVLEQFERTTKSNSLFSNILNIKIAGSRDIESRKIESLASGESIICTENGLEITLYDVDHSLPGASAYLIRDLSTNKKIIYTGDIRKHGPLKYMTEEFIKKAKEFKPDIMICEGTRVNPNGDRDEYSSEEAVGEKLKQIFNEINQNHSEKLIFFDCSLRDIWRIQTIYNTCIISNKTLVLTPKSYDLLKTCIENGIIKDIDLSNIRVFLSKKSTGTYIPKDYSKSPAYVSVLIKEEEDCINIKSVHEKLDITKPFLIKGNEITKNPGKYVIQMAYYLLNDMFDIDPPKNSYYIISRSEPFDDEGEVEDRKLKNWLNLFNIPESNIFQVHCSGHMRRNELIEMIKEIHPKKIFPIHTENAHLFNEMELFEDIEIVEPIKGKKYII